MGDTVIHVVCIVGIQLYRYGMGGGGGGGGWWGRALNENKNICIYYIYFVFFLFFTSLQFILVFVCFLFSFTASGHRLPQHF